MDGIEKWKIIDIKNSETLETRTDGRYPLRIGRIVEKPVAFLGLPSLIYYIEDSDGSDYSGRALRTSRVAGFEKDGELLKMTTLNSIYIFEKVS